MSDHSHKHHRTMTLKGCPASPGIAIGPIYIHQPSVPKYLERTITKEEIPTELDRLTKALARSEKELTKIHAFARKKLGSSESQIIEAQIMLVRDPVLHKTIIQRVNTELRNLEPIIRDEIEKYCQVMIASNNGFAVERAQDVEDAGNRIIRNLQEEKLVSRLDKPYIIVAPQLSPADTLIFSRNEVYAYVTDLGGVTSHTAILSRAMNIPAVLALHDISQRVQTDDVLIVDGYSGIVIINPTNEQIRKYESKRERYKELERKLAHIAPLPPITLDGHSVTVHVNIEFEEEITYSKLQGAEGIGLYRSEMLLFSRDDFPSENEQFAVYDQLAKAVYPLPIIIRTFDIGGDKIFPLHGSKEKNPFLGWRGIRIMLDKEDIFLDQLTAILRASHRKNVSIMLPMVTCVTEIRRTKQLLKKAQGILKKKKIPFDDQIAIGAMVEVPAAAVIADHLASEVSFLSIGSNDLVQYLLAVDRTNDLVTGLYQEFHPAVLRFIRRIILRGTTPNCWVGMCGELASDPIATILLLGLGLQKFSVHPQVVTEIKKIIRSITFEEAQKIALKATEFETAEEVRSYLSDIVKTRFPDLPISFDTNHS